MAELIATWFVRILTIYVTIGALFGIFFVFLGVQRLDPVARGAPFGFRLIIWPGAVALWPALLWRTIRGPGEPRSAHDPHHQNLKS